MPLSLDDFQAALQLHRRDYRLRGVQQGEGRPARWVEHLADLSGIGLLAAASGSVPSSFFPPKEESSDLIVFGPRPGHEPSYQKLLGRSQLSRNYVCFIRRRRFSQYIHGRRSFSR